MRYRSENENLRAHIRTLRGAALAELLVIAALWHGWTNAKRDVRVYLPPDLRSGAVVRLDAPQPENVYAFARYIFQQLNYWPDSGQKDYGEALYRLQDYLTPGFLAQLQSDLEERGKRGELSDRVRSIQEMPGHAYEEAKVTVVGNGVWVVHLDFRIAEHVKGMAVKNVDIRYPLRVLRYDVNPERNPWGLVLDGYAESGPSRMEVSAPVAAPGAQFSAKTLLGGKP